MLDFVYYPVSAVLWLWHNAFAAIFGAASAAAWVLAIVALVASVRTALYRPFLAQVRFSRTMAILQPRLRELRIRYADDRERLAIESRKLQHAHEFNVFAGCLPMLVQAVMFLGLLHVLRSFDRTGPISHLPFLGSPAPMSAARNAATANYVFAPDQVRSFLHAKLFGAALPATLVNSGPAFDSVAVVVIPLIVIATVATHLTARASITRQLEITPQMRVINLATLWLLPLITVLAGLLLPVGILIYFATGNTWTYVQQHLVHRRLGPVLPEPVATSEEVPDMPT